MKQLVVKTAAGRGRFVERTSFPTPTPGLVVQAATGNRSGCELPSWGVVHVRSGLWLCCCLRSPEAALAFTDVVSAWDWTLNAADCCADAHSDRWQAVVDARHRFEGNAHSLGGKPVYEDYADVNPLGDGHA